MHATIACKCSTARGAGIRRPLAADPPLARPRSSGSPCAVNHAHTVDHECVTATFVDACPQALASWMRAAGFDPDLEVTFATTVADVATANISQYKLLYVPSTTYHVPGGIDSAKVGAAVALHSCNTQLALTDAWKPICVTRRAMQPVLWTPPRWAQG